LVTRSKLHPDQKPRAKPPGLSAGLATIADEVLST